MARERGARGAIVEEAEEDAKFGVGAGGGGGGGFAAGSSGGEGMAEGVFHFRVMTDEQMEVLRKQISVYATICQQLVEMHKAIYGTCPRNPHYDSSAAPGGHKMASRQRWSPTPGQLLVLESIFNQGNVAPSKQKVKEIASELASRGQISETNVYNWFQNRRARLKRRHPTAMRSNVESEVETQRKEQRNRD